MRQPRRRIDKVSGVATTVIIWAIVAGCAAGAIAVCFGFAFAGSEPGRAGHPILTRAATFVGTLILTAVGAWFTYLMWKSVRDTWWPRLRGTTLEATVRSVRVIPQGYEEPDHHYATIQLSTSAVLEIRTFPGDRADVEATVRVRYLAPAPQLTRVVRPSVGRFLTALIAESIMVLGFLGGTLVTLMLAYVAVKVAIG